MGLDLKHLNLPELDKVELERRQQRDPDFFNYIGLDRTQMLLDKLKFQHEHSQNVMLGFYGQMGSTKSYSAISLAGQTAQPPTIECIFFKLEDVNEYLPHLKPCDTVIMDERTSAWGVGRDRLEGDYVMMCETLRKRQINFYIVSVLPRARQHCFYLIRALRLTDYKTESFVELEDIGMHCMGHLRLKSPIEIMGQAFMDAYEKKKDDFLDEVQKRNVGDYLSGYAYEVMESEIFHKIDTMYREKALLKKVAYRGLPAKVVLEIVNAKYPRLKRNNEAQTIADRIHYTGLTELGWSA